MSNTYKNIVNGIAGKAKAKYDFYLSRDKDALDNSGTIKPKDHQGQQFTQKIVLKATGRKDFDDARPTNGMPLSAIEYCYNKNKRNSQGKVDKIEWYLPAIDEIEEITIGAYREFNVFQNKYYWSSQPAYKAYEATFEGTYSYSIGIINFGTGYANAKGSYYKDDSSRARATKVYTTDGSLFQNIKSGSNGFWGILESTQNGSNAEIIFKETNYPNPKITYDDGNRPRNSDNSGNNNHINRVRCVYKKINN